MNERAVRRAVNKALDRIEHTCREPLRYEKHCIALRDKVCNWNTFLVTSDLEKLFGEPKPKQDSDTQNSVQWLRIRSFKGDEDLVNV